MFSNETGEWLRKFVLVVSTIVALYLLNLYLGEWEWLGRHLLSPPQEYDQGARALQISGF